MKDLNLTHLFEFFMVVAAAAALVWKWVKGKTIGAEQVKELLEGRSKILAKIEKLEENDKDHEEELKDLAQELRNLTDKLFLYLTKLK